jgi:transcriptional regulator with XRE-family HTH domain
MNLGSIIRKYRKEMKMTLRMVSEKARVSEGFLSQVENNVNVPSVDSLINICSAIGVNASDIISQVEKQEKLVIIRKGDLNDDEIPHSGFFTRRFYPPDNRTIIDSSVILLNPGKTLPGRKNTKNSQEVLTLLEGSVELVHNDKKILLKKGDSVHYWTDIENQSITNISKKRAIILWVGTI